MSTALTIALIVLGALALYALFIALRAWLAEMHHMNRRFENACRGNSGLRPYER